MSKDTIRDQTLIDLGTGISRPTKNPRKATKEAVHHEQEKAAAESSKKKNNKVKFMDKPKSSIFDMPLDAREIRPGEFVSMAPSVLDLTETVGIQRAPDIEVGDMSDISMSHFHPCMFCNVTLKTGVIILAAFEITFWCTCLIVSIVALNYWLWHKSENLGVTLGSTVYNTSNSTHFTTLREALIVQTTICASFALIGVILLLGATLKNSKLCATWLISLGFLTAGRIAAAIWFSVAFMRYGLFYWLIRPFEVWCVYAFMKKTRRMEIRQGKKKSRKDPTPDFVPVTYYGIMQKVHRKDSDFDTQTIRSLPDDGASDKTYKVQYVPKANPKTTKKNSKRNS